MKLIRLHTRNYNGDKIEVLVNVGTITYILKDDKEGSIICFSNSVGNVTNGNGHVGHEALHVCESLEEIRQAVRIG